jgi:hypothetical protein
MRVLSLLKARPRGASQAASRVLTCSACCREWHRQIRRVGVSDQHRRVPRRFPGIDAGGAVADSGGLLHPVQGRVEQQRAWPPRLGSTAVGQHHRQVPQHRRVRMPPATTWAVPAKRIGQPQPVGQLPQQRRAGMTDHADPVGGDFEAGRRVGSLRPQGPSLSRDCDLQTAAFSLLERAPCVINSTRPHASRRAEVRACSDLRPILALAVVQGWRVAAPLRLLLWRKLRRGRSHRLDDASGDPSATGC